MSSIDPPRTFLASLDRLERRLAAEQRLRAARRRRYTAPLDPVLQRIDAVLRPGPLLVTNEG